MNRLTKINSYFLLINGAIGVFAAITLVGLVGNQLPAAMFLVIFAFAAIGIVAGIFSLKSRRWAVWLGAVFYAVQIVQYRSEAFNFFFQSGLSLYVSHRTQDSLIVINLAAIVFMVIAIVVVRKQRA